MHIFNSFIYFYFIFPFSIYSTNESSFGETAITESSTTATTTTEPSTDSSASQQLINEANEFMKTGKIKDALITFNKIIGKSLISYFYLSHYLL